MRLTARGVLINENSGKVLLIKYLDDYSDSTKELTKGFWALPGGGVEKNETFQEALKREIYEETGISNIIIKNCVLSRIAYAKINDIQENTFYERYYLVMTNEEEIFNDNLTSNEIKVIREFKWWSFNELKQTEELVFPQSLSLYIDKVVSNPDYPIDITDLDDVLRNEI